MTAANINRITLALATVGIFIAGVLSLSHFLGVVPPCGAVSGGCERVATHPSSAWFGVPVAYLGLGAYLALAAMAAIRGIKGLSNARFLTYAGYGASAAGMLISFGLTYYSMAVIGATCLWCLASATTMTLSFFAHAVLAQVEPAEGPGSPIDRKLIGGLLGVVLIALTTQGFMLMRGGETLSGNRYKLKTNAWYVPKNAHIIGNKDAPVTIVEFGDLLCPSCKRHFPQVLRLIEESQGRVRLVFRHFPMYSLPHHEESFHAAVLSECAGEKADGKFWDYVAGAYQMEDESVHDLTPLLTLSETVGVPATTVMNRVGNPSDPAYNRVYADLTAGLDINVHATPTFIVLADGVQPLAASYEQLAGILGKEPYVSKKPNVIKQ